MFKFNFNANDLCKSNPRENESEIVKTEELSVPNILVTEPFTYVTLQYNSLKLVNEFPSEYNSDLIPGTYEGGFKLWECTLDLLDYLSNKSIPFEGKSILDLGCGTGLLGIFTLITGAQKVDFQDYNKEVLINSTMCNVMINCEDKLNVCKYYSGDWKSFTDFNEDTYDFILTSETIYNVENYTKLIKLFEKKLKRSGCILLIAKNYYFGVGGSISEFIHFLKSTNMTSDILWETNDRVKKTLLNIHFIN